MGKIIILSEDRSLFGTILMHKQKDTKLKKTKKKQQKGKIWKGIQ